MRPTEPSIPAVAAGRLDRGKHVEVEIDNGLKRLGGRRALKRIRQGFEPGGIGGLKFDQFSDGIVPAARAGTTINRPPRSDHDRRVRRLVAQAIAGLVQRRSRWMSHCLA